MRYTQAARRNVENEKTTEITLSYRTRRQKESKEDSEGPPINARRRKTHGRYGESELGNQYNPLCGRCRITFIVPWDVLYSTVFF